MSLRSLFGKNLKKIRMQKKLTQQEFAELVGLQPNFIAQIETGYRAVSFKTIEKIVKSININYKELFDFENNQSNEQLQKDIISLTEKLNANELKFIVNIIKQFNKFRNN